MPPPDASADQPAATGTAGGDSAAAVDAQIRDALDGIGEVVDLIEQAVAELRASQTSPDAEFPQGGPLRLTPAERAAAPTLPPLPDGAVAMARATPLPADFPVRKHLVGAGLDTLQAVAAASDAEIVAIRYVTENHLPLIRAACVALLTPEATDG